MKSLWLLCAAMLSLANASPFAAQGRAASIPPTAFQRDAIAREKKLIEAKQKDDDQFFKQTLSRDFELVGIDGRLLEGEEAAGDLGDSGLVELTPYDMKVLAVGENGAIVTYDAVVREAPEEDQGPQPRYQHFSSVWIMEAGQWKLKFQQATAVHWGDW
jgi:hypothetical protein